MKIIEIQDKYNENKKWLIKKSCCRHYFFTQKLFDKQIFPYSKTTLNFVASVIEVSCDNLQYLFKNTL